MMEWMNYSPLSIAVLETTVLMICNRRKKGGFQQVRGVFTWMWCLMLMHSFSDCFSQYFPPSMFTVLRRQSTRAKNLSVEEQRRQLGKLTWTRDASRQTWFSSSFLRPSNSPTGPGAERARAEECPGQNDSKCKLTCHDPLPRYRVWWVWTTSHVQLSQPHNFKLFCFGIGSKQRCRTDILLTLASSPDVCKKHTMQPSFLQRRQRPQIVRFK